MWYNGCWSFPKVWFNYLSSNVLGLIKRDSKRALDNPEIQKLQYRTLFASKIKHLSEFSDKVMKWLFSEAMSRSSVSKTERL